VTKALSNGLGLSIVSIDTNKRVFPCLLDKVDRDRVDFVACDFSSLPFRKDTFCAVICDLAISTSRGWKPFPIYTEFKRALMPRSSLFITDYYPEKSPTTKEALLAAQTSKLYRMVLEAKGTSSQKGVPPQSTVRQLRKAGFATVKKKRIEANEAQEWKKRVFEEYYNGMKAEISNLSGLKLEAKYMKKLEELKKEIDSNGRINWAWGANYLIQATK
jgi:ubiquinone/menaquinone biosynthesis C-methylase UbiE